jgi:hypothetical protein
MSAMPTAPLPRPVVRPRRRRQRPPGPDDHRHRSPVRQIPGAGDAPVAPAMGRSAIPKSVRPDRIRENFDVLEPELTADELGAINALDTGIRRGPEPAGITLETSCGRSQSPRERRRSRPHGLPPLCYAAGALIGRGLRELLPFRQQVSLPARAPRCRLLDQAISRPRLRPGLGCHRGSAIEGSTAASTEARV